MLGWRGVCFLADCLSSTQIWPVVGSSFGWLIYLWTSISSIWSLVLNHLSWVTASLFYLHLLISSPLLDPLLSCPSNGWVLRPFLGLFLSCSTCILSVLLYYAYTWPIAAWCILKGTVRWVLLYIN